MYIMLLHNGNSLYQKRPRREVSPMCRFCGSSIYLSSYNCFNCKTVVGDDTKLLSAEYSFSINILVLITPAFHRLILCVCVYEVDVSKVVCSVTFCCTILRCPTHAINKAIEPSRSAYFSRDWQFLFSLEAA